MLFVLPLKGYRDINLANSILLPSIYYFYKSDYKIYIIINKKYEYLINKNKNIKIIDENSVYNISKNSYYYQMLLKLYIANYINDDYYMTLDADVLFTKNCKYDQFFIGDKIRWQIVNKKDMWSIRTSKYYNIDIDFITNQTPFIFKTEIVKKMINDIDVYDCIMNKNCSEYTLYLGYLIKNNLLDIYVDDNFVHKIINNSIVRNNKIDLEILLSEAFLLDDNRFMSIIQSRCNVHHQLIDTINTFIPNITSENVSSEVRTFTFAKRIKMAHSSYKKYNIGVLTIVDKNYYDRYKEALFIKRDYCKYHNYDFIIKIIDNCNGWDKIYLLKEHLHKYDYIFMSDGDVVITNRDISIEELLIKYGEPELFTISEDYNSLNSGNMIWANNDISHNFINDMIKLYVGKYKLNISELNNNPYKIIGVYEQPYLIHLINICISSKMDNSINNDYYKKIIIIPQKEINSYIYNSTNTINKNIYPKWENGDFLVHFAGLNKQFKNLDKYIKMFCNIYKINIIQKEGKDYGNIK
jgi:hypothetical protein